MTVADDVVRVLRTSPTGMTDAELAKLLGKNHPQINQVCNRLAGQGLIVRDKCYGNIVNKMAGDAQSPRVSAVRQAADGAGEQEWAWEGNVQDRVRVHLAADGWTILHTSDTSRRERGDDIIAERAGQRLVVEVKGWRTANPSAQAFIAFAEGLAKLAIRGAEPGLRLALALPDKPRYRTFLGEAGWALERLDITVYLVRAEGAVEIWEREN